MLMKLVKIEAVVVDKIGAVDAGKGYRETGDGGVNWGRKVLVCDVGRGCICLKVAREKIFVNINAWEDKSRHQ